MAARRAPVLALAALCVALALAPQPGLAQLKGQVIFNEATGERNMRRGLQGIVSTPGRLREEARVEAD